MTTRTLIAVPVVVVDTAICATIEILLSGVAGRSRLVDEVTRVRARGIAAGAGLTVEAAGLENVNPGRSYVVVSNHQSHLDSVALFLTCPVPLRMLAKKELFRIPIFGRALARTGHIRIDREHAGGLDWGALAEAVRELGRAGRSIMVFAEGTRSSDGRLGPFKRGAFQIAATLGLPILPVAITGTREVLPARKISFRPGRALVRYLPAIEPRGSPVDKLRDRVRAAIARALASGTDAGADAGAGRPS